MEEFIKNEGMGESNINGIQDDGEFQKIKMVELKKAQKLEERRLRDEAESKERKERAFKSMKYLLGVSEKYSNFFKQKLCKTEVRTNTKKITKRVIKNRLHPSMKDMVDDDILQVKGFNNNEKNQADCNGVLKQLKYFEGSLRPYQVEGLSWMVMLFENGVNGILADEMGLGKTIQVIALICHLMERNIQGPYLIVVPLSTLGNWMSEFKKFAPQIPVCCFYGNQFERAKLCHTIPHTTYYLGNMQVKPVLITSYQMPLYENKFMKKFTWQYVIVDEGHRIKNPESQLGIHLRDLQSKNRLILTGTPLQNNMTELWSLLNFLLPNIFTDVDTFAEILAMDDMNDSNKIIESEKSNSLLTTIHRVLAPFMLRRMKSDVLHDMVPKKEVQVYCPMTNLQMELYSFILQKNLAKLKCLEETGSMSPKRKRACTEHVQEYVTKFFKWERDEDFYENTEDQKISGVIKQQEKLVGKQIDKNIVQYIYRVTMQSPLVMLRKTVDHPYLVHFPLDPSSKEKKLLINEDLIAVSGKMLVLDAMLAKLKEKGHKVLIFSTLVIMLDLIEELMIMRNYKYGRLDGGHRLMERTENIDRFNTHPDSFVFLLSTRAGGLGINLTAADTVIFYDRDWNPQTDIQAQDRCHRIGQTKPVMVYTLVTKNTVDEKIIKCGEMKRKLEKVVMRDGKFKSLTTEDRKSAEEDWIELQQLLESDTQTKIHSNGYVYSDEELEKLLDRSELYDEMKK